MPVEKRVAEENLNAKVPKASVGNIVWTILSAFLGIRKRARHDEETVSLSPVQIIVAGLIGAAVFVVGLVLLAKFIVGRAMS
ncbi:MAG: DUF2970 domain-containing protein [Burkholderiales bacterium]